MPYKRDIELYVLGMGFAPALLGLWVTAQLFPSRALGQNVPTPRALAARETACPADFKSLAENLAKDLRGYLNRTYMRMRSRAIVEAVGLPELEPLPLAAGDRANGKSVTVSDPQQLFLTVLERKAGQVKTSETAYWLFMSHTRNGWRLAMAFTRVGNAPPRDVSDGIIANAVRTWLRDRCEEKAGG